MKAVGIKIKKYSYKFKNMYEKSERKNNNINSFQNIEYKKKISIEHNRFRAPIESDQTTYRSIFCRKELM